MMLSNAVIKIYKRLLYFGDHSNLHGLRFVTEEKRKLWCRIFWALALLGCSICFYMMLKGTIKSYREDALSFNPDINRRNFQTTFPAVSICEDYQYSGTAKKINKLFPGLMDQYDFDYKKMITDQCFADTPCELCSLGCKPPINCSIDFKTIAKLVRSNCDELIHDCMWLDQPFDCCKYFLPIDTNFGTCYSLNTLQSKLSGSVSLFRSNISTGPGEISFSVYKTIKVFIHGIDDIPWSQTELFFKTEGHIKYYFTLVEMANSPRVEEVDMGIRKCRFKSETVPSVYGQAFQMYSYSTCVVSCERQIMFERCHCLHHLMDVHQDPRFSCNYTGLGCLAEYEIETRTTGPVEQWCRHCLPSCEEVELTKVILLEPLENDEDDSDEDDEEDFRINIIMTSLPTIQYKRNVVRNKLDLGVSIGGLVGLFFGASLISLVEAIYFLCIRSGAHR